MRKFSLMILISIILLGCIAAPQEVSELYKKNFESVVVIHSKRTNLFSGVSEIKFNGSGFIINEHKGLIITCFHLIKDAENVMVELNPGIKSLVSIYAIDSDNDIAILKIDPKLINRRSLPNLQLDLAPVVGQTIFCIGNPVNLTNTISLGVLSRGLTYLDGLWASFSSGFYLSDIHIVGGNSGSPVFDLDGKIVGMVAGFWHSYIIIIPANSIDKVLKENANN